MLYLLHDPVIELYERLITFDEFGIRRSSCSLFQVICQNYPVGINELRPLLPNSFPAEIVAYLLKARTVEAEKQPLPGNVLYIRSRETLHSAVVATQLPVCQSALQPWLSLVGFLYNQSPPGVKLRWPKTRKHTHYRARTHRTATNKSIDNAQSK
jgi:hypothetical protein